MRGVRKVSSTHHLCLRVVRSFTKFHFPQPPSPSELLPERTPQSFYHFPHDLTDHDPARVSKPFPSECQVAKQSTIPSQCVRAASSHHSFARQKTRRLLYRLSLTLTPDFNVMEFVRGCTHVVQPCTGKGMPHNVQIAVAVVITRGEAQVFEYSTVLIIILHNPLMRGTSLA